MYGNVGGKTFNTFKCTNEIIYMGKLLWKYVIYAKIVKVFSSFVSWEFPDQSPSILLR